MVKKLSILTMLFSVAILITSCGSYLDLNNQEKQSPELHSEKVDLEIYESLKDNEMIPVIVKLKDNYDANNLEAAKVSIASNQDSVLNTLTSNEFNLKNKYVTVNAFSGQVSQEGLNKLIGNENVEMIYYDQVLHTLLAQSIPQIHANTAWTLRDSNNTNITGLGQTICIIDTGVDYTHPDLGGCFGQGCKVVGGYDFVNNDNNPMDDSSILLGHGTQVTGVMAAKGSTYNGVAKDANVVAIKACDSSGFCSSSYVMAGIDWCLNHKNEYNIQVISISLGFGGGFLRTTCPTNMDSSISTAVNNYKVPIVAASGNDGNKVGIVYPACNPEVIAVGATYDAPGGFSQWECDDGGTELVVNDTITCGSSSSEDLDLVAPGYSIRSVKLGGGYTSGFPYGTSFSAPHVAGTIALMKQMNPTPSMDPERIVSILKTTGVPKVDAGNGLTFPRIDVYQAVLASKPISNPGSSPFILKIKSAKAQQQL